MDIFNHKAFSLESLTTGYNSATVMDDSILSLFKVENVENRTVNLVSSDKQLQVLMPGEIGQSPNKDTHDGENAKPVNLIRYPFDSSIVPSDLQRINSLQDKKIQAADLATMVKSHMTKHKQNHRYTAVYTAYSALKGVVKDKKGDERVNLFTIMGETPRVVDLKLGTPGTKVPDLIKKLAKDTKSKAKEHGHMTIKGIECRLGQDVIERILNHDSIKAFYSEEIHAKRVVTFADDPTSINICGVKFITDEATEVMTEGAAYPVGVDLFAMLRAPADVMSASSTGKRECHITTEKKDHDEGLEIRSRAIYLPICRDVSLLCTVKSSN